jgi:hypothetical protein
MKIISVILSTALLATGINSVFAAENIPANPTPMTQPADSERAHPCRNIMIACKDAGYYPGGSSKGKGLLGNCLVPIMKGETVPGVKADPQDIKACQAVHEQKQQQMKNMGKP